MYIPAFERSSRKFSIWAAAVAAALTIPALGASPAHAGAGVFEIIHPDVEQGEIEIEVLNGIALDEVDDGEERSVHEFAIGFGVTDFWKLTGALELANPEAGGAEVEAFELESLVLLFGGHGHDEDGKSEAAGAEHHGLTVGLFTALEIPRESGIDEGALEIGPVVETELGELKFVGNLFVEVPFADGEDPGLAYATQLVLPISENLGVGIENYGEFEGLFGDGGEEVHFAGPGIYWHSTLPNGHVFEPRLAVLFGLNDEAADAILSANIEYKIPPR